MRWGSAELNFSLLFCAWELFDPVLELWLDLLIFLEKLLF